MGDGSAAEPAGPVVTVTLAWPVIRRGLIEDRLAAAGISMANLLTEESFGPVAAPVSW
jgi:hypothetical protein